MNSETLEQKKTRVKTLTTNTVMRSIGAAFFVYALALLVLFSGVSTANAHQFDDNHGPESITVGDVNVMKKEDMEALLEHVKAHWAKTDTPNALTQFRVALR